MKKLFIITGEHSGDLHASHVVQYLKKCSDDVQIEAVGGVNLQNAGVKLFCDHSKMSAAGLDFKILVDHIQLGKRLADYLKNEYKPDLILLVDYGGFNLSISKVLHKAGFKIFYFIPPQVWASRKWRLKAIKKNIDKVFTIFPFEKPFYEDFGIDAEFAGNPIVKEIPPKANKEEFFKKYNLEAGKKLVSIFPGSRVFEIKMLLNNFLKAAQLIQKKYENVQFVLCQAPNIDDKLLAKYNIDGKIKIIKNDNYSILSASDVLILASGTVALEAAIYQTPMLVSYRGPWFFYLVFLLVRSTKRVSLPNIIAQKDIVSELIQKKSTPECIANEAVELLSDEIKYNNMKTSLGEIKALLGEKNAPEEVAKAIHKAFFI